MCLCMKDDRVQIQIKENHDGEYRSLVLDSILTLPPEQEEEENNLKGRGIVVFAHGSGSSGRHSPGSCLLCHPFVESFEAKKPGFCTGFAMLCDIESPALSEIKR
jgi:hypothetical protein